MSSTNPERLCPFCPCVTMPSSFVTDADDQIGDGTCPSCAQALNSFRVDREDNCNYQRDDAGDSCEDPADPIDVILAFSEDGAGQLIVNLRYDRAVGGGQIAEYEQSYATLTYCAVTHTLDRQSFDATCTWPSTIKVKPAP